MFAGAFVIRKHLEHWEHVTCPLASRPCVMRVARLFDFTISVGLGVWITPAKVLKHHNGRVVLGAGKVRSLGSMALLFFGLCCVG
jgi:hypothetical protein